MNSPQSQEPNTALRDIRERYTFEAAEAVGRQYDAIMHEALTASPKPVIPLTRWQKIKRVLTKRRSFGLWLTHKLMNYYDIYEGDY